MKLLLVEDEKRMAQAVSKLLSLEGYEVDVAYDGMKGCDMLCEGTYDLAILDVMLPNMNGFEIVKEARGLEIATPIIMLTARSDISDKVMGLDMGADDYLTKPFEVEELLARVRALLRREIKTNIEGILKLEDLELNTKTCMLTSSKSKKEIRLPEKEFKIMECLMANKGQIISKEQLATKVWGFDSEAEYNNVEVYISFTRKKLSFLKTGCNIKSVRGMGYEIRSE